MPTLTEAQVVAQLSAAHTTYMTGGSTETIADQNERETLDNSSHTAVANGAFEDLNGTEAPGANVTGRVYTGGNIITPVQATYFESKVTTAVQAGTAFTTGGPYTSEYSLAAPYVDPLTLIEASKLTGEKFF